MGVYEHFDDVPELSSQLGGLFEGGALNSLNTVRHKMDPGGSGFFYEIACETCGQPTSILVSFDELMVCSLRQLPIDPETRQPWIYDAARGGVYPRSACRTCRNPIAMLLTAEECAKRVREGIAARKVDPRRWNQLADHFKVPRPA
jgi:hypothetical protein